MLEFGSQFLDLAVEGHSESAAVIKADDEAINLPTRTDLTRYNM
jgi:hypothetical protein